MKAVKVEYKVQEHYVEQNKANIRTVMAALRAQPIDGMHYASFTLDDVQTFLHVNMAKDEDTLSKLSKLPEFQAFRAALKESGPVAPPQRTDLHLVDSGFEL